MGRKKKVINREINKKKFLKGGRRRKKEINIFKGFH
jgi:hypothetical protein